MIKKIPIVLIVLMLTSCDSKEVVEVLENELQLDVIEKEDVIIEEVEEILEKEDIEVKEELEEELLSQEIEVTNEIYKFSQEEIIRVLEENLYLAKGDIVYFEQGDFDKDEQQEIVIAFDNYYNIYYLEDTGDNFTIEEIPSGGYGVYDMMFVDFEGFENSLLCLLVTNDMNLYGFRLYQFENNKLDKLVESASATGSGYDEIIDSNEDGVFDGYVQHRSSYDYLYQRVAVYYDYIDGEFVMSNYIIKDDVYFEGPQDVVLYYYTLSVLENIAGVEVPSIQYILEDISTVKVDIDFDFINYNTINNTHMLYDYPQLYLEEIIYEDEATVTVSYVEEEEETLYQTFNLELIADEWKIVDYQ